MNVEHVRKILAAAGNMHAQAGSTELAGLINELAAILKPYDKSDLKEFVDRVAKLRAAKSEHPTR